MNMQIINHPAYDLAKTFLGRNIYGTNLFCETNESIDRYSTIISQLEIDSQSNLVRKDTWIRIIRDPNNENMWTMYIDNTVRTYDKNGMQIKEEFHTAEYPRIDEQTLKRFKDEIRREDFSSFIGGGAYSPDFINLLPPGKHRMGKSFSARDRYVIFEPAEESIGLVSRREVAYEGDWLVKQDDCLEARSVNKDPRILLYDAPFSHQRAFPVLQYEKFERQPGEGKTRGYVRPYIPDDVLKHNPDLTIENMNEYYTASFLRRLYAGINEKWIKPESLTFAQDLCEQVREQMGRSR